MVKAVQSVSTRTFDRAIQQLKASTKKWSLGYVGCRVSLIALRDGTSWKILTGQIICRIGNVLVEPRVIESPGVIAMQVDIEKGFAGALKLFLHLRKGMISLAGRKFTFPLDQDLSGSFDFLSPNALREGRRISILRVFGAMRHQFFDRTKVDWELRAAGPPFDGIADLASEIGLAVPESDRVHFEFALLNVAEIDYSSAVQGEVAQVKFLMARKLDARKIRVGYKVFHARQMKARGFVEGKALSPIRDGEFIRGGFQLSVPKASVVQLFVSYDGSTQHQYWIVDAAALPNARRSVYALFDKELEVLNDYLFEKAQPRKIPQRDFEDGVAILLFISGFSVVNLGGVSRLQDAVDGLCYSPSGDYAVIECTVGHPDNDDKLSKLFSRSQLVRGALDRAGLQQKKLLPVLVTAMSKSEIPEPEIEKAAGMGVIVACREDLVSALQRAEFGENADRVFADAVRALEARQANSASPSAAEQ
jgi:hypothetical protein